MAKNYTSFQVASGKERKVQYVYKQGGQTVLIDYPMSEEAYSKLKNATISNSTHSTTSGNTVVVKQQPKILMSATSVDTLANSLISQITTPVNVNNGQQQKQSLSKNQETKEIIAGLTKDGKKFQFAFGSPTGSGGSTATVSQKNFAGSSTGEKVEVTVNGATAGTARQLHVINGPSGNNSNVAAVSSTQRCIVQAISPAKVQYNTTAIMRSSPQSQRTQGEKK